MCVSQTLQQNTKRKNKNPNFTQLTVSDRCMKKSTATIIIVEPTILDATIVKNFTHSNVVTANTMAPPPTATTISLNYAKLRKRQLKIDIFFIINLFFVRLSNVFVGCVSLNLRQIHDWAVLQCKM